MRAVSGGADADTLASVFCASCLALRSCSSSCSTSFIRSCSFSSMTDTCMHSTHKHHTPRMTTAHEQMPLLFECSSAGLCNFRLCRHALVLSSAGMLWPKYALPTCCQFLSASVRASMASNRIRSTLYHSASATFRALSARQTCNPEIQFHFTTAAMADECPIA